MMNKIIFISMTIILFCVSVCVGQSEVIAGEREPLLKQLVGVKIAIEGLAWGEGAKGLAEHVLLPSGACVYFPEGAVIKDFSNGRLVRVTGKLEIRQMMKAPPGAQGYSETFDYYVVSDYQITLIKRVVNPLKAL
jgi:hypothetical protein